MSEEILKTLKDERDKAMMEVDSWRIVSQRFCGTHTTDKKVADYWLERGEAYPLYKKEAIALPVVRGVSIDSESPRKASVLIHFERQLTDEEIRALHSMLAANPPPSSN